MGLKSNLRLIVVFAVAFSLASLTGSISSNFHLPTMLLAHASPAPCVTHGASGPCSPSFWYPAGPAMNTELVTIFTDETAEYANLESPSPSIDFTDAPCSPVECAALNADPRFLVTAPVAQVAYYEIQFHLANDFWGCQFNFGNSACGVQIRQGIAHMIDKTAFTAHDPSIANSSSPIDNPLPTNSGGGLLSPNPCGYDASFPESGAQCVVGAAGGTSYHLANAIGANGLLWAQAPGSADLNAAAQHFVNAGLASGFNPVTSVLTGISSTATSVVPSFFIRTDDSARLDLGNSLAEQICYLFTGSYAAPCPYLSTVRGPITAFPGLTTSGCPTPGPGTCTTGVNLNWWMYTGAFSGPTFFDGSLYFGYNSRFVSGTPSIQPPNGPCSAQAVPTANAADYMYLCSPGYDSISSRMENAPCLSASGDPVAGATSNLPSSPGNGLCSGTSQLSGHSAGIQAEALFGANAFTLPIYERTVQYAYLNNGWIRAINSDGHGLPNYFTWLNTWNPNAALCKAFPCPGGTYPGAIRQGFSQTTRSVNPFIATSVHDLYIVSNVYDSLYAANPLSPSQTFNWMTVSTFQKDNASLAYPGESCQPAPNNEQCTEVPAHTLTTYRFALRDDLYFQDGRQVTAYDVAFSYLSMVGQGSFLGTGATPMTGITILGPTQFDISVSSIGPFTLPNLAGIPIVPGRYWTSGGSSQWDSAAAACLGPGAGCHILSGTGSQYTLTGSTVNCITGLGLSCSTFPASLMTVNPADAAATFDPVVAHIFVGSGPWTCGIVTSSGSGTCTTSFNQNPPFGGSYTLTRFGAGLAPASSISEIYFRSAGNLALYLWSQANNVNPPAPLSIADACFLKPVDLTGSCAHFQQGIGSENGIGGAPAPVSSNGPAIESRFFNVNWVEPYQWTTSPPLGIAPLPPVLYEGSVTLTPAPPGGCPGPYYLC